ncbi:hypothetical protein SAMN05421780_11910 [Flexibacter flexilis DSM 6793]|uniref:Uncharacterized protein n=1 Tax=Flexibacter flexilis DSM 6793 TaxID=927664 RepID=A0A1I1NSP3_9BACT|nr:hypothetical protein [Flexibacter flexilis]SFD00684.1 hypothetical protein SAMN05421780_11910 [Flexibacter flexilis DSM 6793]
MNDKQLREYFEKEIAAKLPEIQHSATQKRFGTIDIEDVYNSLRNDFDLRGYCLLIEFPEKTTDLQDLDSVFQDTIMAYTVLRKVEKSNIAEREEVLVECERIGKKILSKILHHARTRQFFKNTTFRPIPIQKVGPVFDNAYGKRFEVTFYESDNQQLIFKADEWDD